MALDGVFDRFPTLRGGVIELGAGWVPDFLRRLDQAWKGWRKTDPVIGAAVGAAVRIHPPRGALHAVRHRERRNHHPRRRPGAVPVLVRLSAPRGHQEPDRAVREQLRGPGRGRTRTASTAAISRRFSQAETICDDRGRSALVARPILASHGGAFRRRLDHKAHETARNQHTASGGEDLQLGGGWRRHRKLRRDGA